MASRSSYSRIYEVVRRIPQGKVATYGQVATLAGLAGNPRQVGYALSALPDESGVPWHRVLNARGQISPRANPHSVAIQRSLLESEGVVFDSEARLSLTRYQWKRSRPFDRGSGS